MKGRVKSKILTRDVSKSRRSSFLFKRIAKLVVRGDLICHSKWLIASLPYTVVTVQCTRKRCRHFGRFLAAAWRVNTQSWSWTPGGEEVLEKFHWRSSVYLLFSTSFPDGVSFSPRLLLVLSVFGTYPPYFRKVNHPFKSLSSYNQPTTLACAFSKRSLSLLLLTSRNGENERRSLLCCTSRRVEKHHSMVSQ